MPEVKKVYVTKYLFTKGIVEYDIENCGLYGNILRIKGSAVRFHKPYWYLNRDEAENYAKIQVQEKIKELEKQIEELRHKKF